MTICYKSFDGHIFDTIHDCHLHENIIYKQNFKRYCDMDKVKIYREDGTLFYFNPYKVNFDSENFFDEVYLDAVKVVIHNLKELRGFLHFSRDAGWNDFYCDINSPGTWVFKHGCFIKQEE